ncbi:MAG: coenzyme F420-0:L-glutamate ligase [Desulfurococcaceae archaeon]
MTSQTQKESTIERIEKLKVELFGLRLPEIRPGDDLVEAILKAASIDGVKLQDYDVLVVTSKVLSKALGLLVNIEDVKPSRKAYRIARRAGSDPRFVELLLRESDGIVVAVPFKKLVEKGVVDVRFLSEEPSKAVKALELYPTIFLTIRDGMLWSESGIDTSNHPHGVYSIPPRNLDEIAKQISEEIFRRTGKKVAVVISDTELFPWGAMDVARGSYGIKPVKMEFGEPDSYGKPKFGGVDNIAFVVSSAAALLMGQRGEGIPVVIVRGLKYEWSDEGVNKTLAMRMSPKRLLKAFLETVKHTIIVLGLSITMSMLMLALKGYKSGEKKL